MVSRDHARIEKRGEKFIIRDLGSTNGTFVGGSGVDSPLKRDQVVIEVIIHPSNPRLYIACLVPQPVIATQYGLAPDQQREEKRDTLYKNLSEKDCPHIISLLPV
jgi:pSer/pThr/pTyr-binding forkhead associated (FHA) protein